jgi:hypothetical protein
MSKNVIKALTPLFFNAKQKEVPLSPPQFCVVGDLPGVTPTPHDFKVFKKKFAFVSYEQAVVAGLARWRAMFGNYGGLDLHKLGNGRDFQWFKAQLCDDTQSFLVHGEPHYASFTIDYGYDSPTFVKFQLGIYRSRCTNGLIFGFKELGKLRVRGSELWNLDFFFLRCLWAAVLQEYEEGVRVLKGTRLDRKRIRSLVNAYLSQRSGRGSASALLVRHSWSGLRPVEPELLGHFEEADTQLDMLIDKYVHDPSVGESAYAALNVITEIASHYFVSKRRPAWGTSAEATDAVSRALFQDQEEAGTWFESIVAAIRQQNPVERLTSAEHLEHERFGRYPERESYEFDVEAFLNADE